MAFEREASEPFGSRVTYIATAKGVPLKLFQLEHLFSTFRYEPVVTAGVSCDHPFHVALNHAPPAFIRMSLDRRESTGAVIPLGKADGTAFTRGKNFQSLRRFQRYGYALGDHMGLKRRRGWYRLALVLGALWWAGVVLAMFYRSLPWTLETVLGTVIAIIYAAYVGWAAILFVREGFKGEKS